MLHIPYEKRECSFSLPNNTYIEPYKKELVEIMSKIEPLLQSIDHRIKTGQIEPPDSAFTYANNGNFLAIAVDKDSQYAKLAYFNAKDRIVTSEIPFEVMKAFAIDERFYYLEDTIKDFGVREFDKALTGEIHKKIQEREDR